MTPSENSSVNHTNEDDSPSVHTGNHHFKEQSNELLGSIKSGPGFYLVLLAAWLVLWVVIHMLEILPIWVSIIAVAPVVAFVVIKSSQNGR